MFKYFAGVFFAAAAQAAPILYAIGANQSGVPNQLVQIDVANSAANPIVTLGNGSQSYAGGLIALGSNLFGGFETAGNGLTAAVAFNSSGAIGGHQYAPEFVPGGLAYRATPQERFWTSNDSNGDSVLVIATVGATPIGTGFTGGLAYREANGTLYAIRNDSNGNSTFHYYDTNTSQMVQLGISLGSGFLGGLAWDPGADLFYALGSDSNANATLYRFAVGDATPTALFGVGQGYLYAALTVDAAGEPGGGGVPEPSTYLLCGAALLAVGLVNRKHR